MTASAALARLRAGNQRYVQRVHSIDSLLSHDRRVGDETPPFAIVLGCSEPRAPAEIVFDQGVGDLFVIRVAGNVADLSQIGSVEFAAQRFGTRLVVVMGHTECGAIDAALASSTSDLAISSGHLHSIINRVRPAIEALRPLHEHDWPGLRRHVIRANVRTSVDQLRHGSEVLERLTRIRELVVVGAELDVASGAVTFLDEA